MRCLRAIPCLAVTIGLVFIAASRGETAKSDRFVQDRILIGFWVDPPADERMDERYKEIADANFTVVFGGFGALTPEEIDWQLALCDKYGLGVLVTRHGKEPDVLPDGPAVWGYSILDEPGPEEFADLRRKGDIIREKRPGKLSFTNLLPNYARRSRLGGTYDDYVRRFCEEVRPDVLSMDHYPHFRPDRDGRDGYCENLAVLREYALQYDIPFWNFFNSMPFQAHTDPTEAQLRWQIFTSLAYGAKGVMYFCYYTPLSWEFPKGGAVIARDNGKTRHWQQAQRINAQLNAWSPTIMKLTSTAVIRIAPGDIPSKKLALAPIDDILREERDPLHDYLIGVFRHDDGQQAVLINNYHFAYTAWPTVVFEADPSRIVEIDRSTGEEIPVRDDSPDMDGLQLSLDAGEGRLFLTP